MGQVTSPSSPGITVNPIDRETGPGAGAGQSGNRVIMLGLGAGLNTTASDMLVLGNSALGAGLTTNSVGTVGLIVIGSGALANATTGTVETTAASIAIGYKCLSSQGVTNGGFGNLLAIGSKILGDTAAVQTYALNQCILIGHGIAKDAANTSLMSNCLVIGHQTLQSGSAGSGLNNSIVIGNACFAAGATTNAYANMVMIGHGITNNSTAGANNSILIGSSLQVGTGIGNVVLTQAINAIGNSNVYIGQGSNVQPFPVGSLSANSQLIMSGGGIGLIYGRFDLGNIQFGATTGDTNRDFATSGVTNAVKLLNGTRGAGNPVGGGFFYVAAGALHWVGSSGTDTTIAPA